MDEIVARAIAKWPNVPAVYGWLSLDQRGNWAIKGARIRNPMIAAFIARNYARDERGRWFFQNGPQRVFVRLAYTPLVYRARSGGALSFVAHTGQDGEHVRQAWFDDQGRLLVQTELGIGVLHDQDLSEVLPYLAGLEGLPLEDDAIEQLLDAAAKVDGAAAATAPLPARLYTASGPAPLSTILAGTVPDTFRFDPDPRPAPGEPEC